MPDYSRILIPLPPVQSIKEEVTKLVSDTFKIMPEYIETPMFEGYAFTWGSWYDFDSTLKYPNMRSFFQLHLKQILYDWLDEEEMLAVEWIDKDRWWWLDIEKDTSEIFYAVYYSGISSVTVYQDGLLIHKLTKWNKIRNDDWNMLEKEKECYPIYKVLARRGYWNGIKGREDFYRQIGFDFRAAL